MEEETSLSKSMNSATHAEDFVLPVEQVVSIADFRKALGAKADGMSDNDLERSSERMRLLARALFNSWKGRFDADLSLRNQETMR